MEIADAMLKQTMYEVLATNVAAYARALDAQKLQAGTAGYLVSQFQAALWDRLTFEAEQERKATVDIAPAKGPIKVQG